MKLASVKSWNFSGGSSTNQGRASNAAPSTLKPCWYPAFSLRLRSSMVFFFVFIVSFPYLLRRYIDALAGSSRARSSMYMKFKLSALQSSIQQWLSNSPPHCEWWRCWKLHLPHTNQSFSGVFKTFRRLFVRTASGVTLAQWHLTPLPFADACIIFSLPFSFLMGPKPRWFSH